MSPEFSRIIRASHPSFSRPDRYHLAASLPTHADPTGASLSRPVLGITLIVSALFLYTVQDMVIKAYADRFSILQIMCLRSVVALVVLAIIVWLKGGLAGFVPHRPWIMMLRGLFGFLAYLGYYLAIAAMPLAQVVAIVFTAPIFVTVFSSLLLGEQVGPRRWTAVVVGFLSVLLVLGPSGNFFQLAAFLALFAAATYAAMILMTAAVNKHNNGWQISFYASIAFLVGSVLAAFVVHLWTPEPANNPAVDFLVRDWAPANTNQLLIFLSLGLITAFGQYGLVMAYSVAPMSTVAPFEYTYIIWAVLFGYWFWGEVPGLFTVLGIVTIISCNLYILYRERQIELESARR